MIRLDTTTRSLELVLAGAITTTNPDIVASYSDKTSSAYTGGTKATVGNGVTVVTIVAAPAASTIRDIDHINLINNDTISITATIKLNDNATLYKLVTITLLTGESLEYTHAIGWVALDVNGNRKEATASNFTNITASGTLTLGGVALNAFVDDETPAGTINGSNAVFTLAFAPSPAASLQFFNNGLLQRAGGVHYTLAGLTITTTAGATPQTGDNLSASYRR